MSVFERVIGWLAPADCAGCGLEGTGLCEACAASEILPFGERCFNCHRLSERGRTCPACRKNAPRFVFVVTNYESLAKEILRRYKFVHQRSLAEKLAGLMAEQLKQRNDTKTLAKFNYLIVPVPTASQRVRERGFDHASLLAKKLASLSKLECSQALIRRGQSRQVGAKRDERLKLQGDAYRVWRPDKISGRNVLLIDDVVTTGATLRAATKALRAAGARRVDALVFAKSI